MIQQKMSQKMLQRLSPQQIQVMKLLQIPTAMFDQRIEEELESNPALDEGDKTEEKDEFDNNEEKPEEPKEDATIDSYLEEYREDDPISYNQTSNKRSDEDYLAPVVKVEHTFHDFLLNQMQLRQWKSEQQEIIAKHIIGSIDEDGYLRRETESIIDDLAFSLNIEIDPAEIEATLEIIQAFDPPGLGARNLEESLMIQLKRKLESDTNLNEGQEDRLLMALKIIKDHFVVFSRKNYEKLITQLGVDAEELKGVLAEITKLNPKPLSGTFAGFDNSNHYIVPDFIVENKDGELSLSLHGRNAPELNVNRQYVGMLENFKLKTKNRKATTTEKETIQFIKQKIETARWFIDAIKQRQNTLYNAMYAIMQLQYDYFLTGDPLKIKPMILKDVAELTFLDISTISRVATNKYVQTEFGTKRLKEFFSEAIKTTDGEEVSTLEVKNTLQGIVKNENKKAPFSDEILKNKLLESGYTIARRTVTKYREQLHIPKAKLRREL